MRRFSLLALVVTLASSSALAEGRIPKETCGIQATQSYFKFVHQGAMMDDDASIAFTKDGGFKIYDENGTNHEWVLDANGLILTLRGLTRGSRGYTNYALDSVPRVASSSANRVGAIDWTTGFEMALHDIVNMETTLTAANNADTEKVRTALNCAHLILINAVARGQERLLEGKTNTRF